MSNWKEELTLEDLGEPYYTIGVELGIEAALKMEEIFHGKQIYFQSLKNAFLESNKEKIVNEYNGYNMKELAKKYDFTERFIRKLVKENKTNS